ncbi:DUF5655 domain-containing protein [Kitasatospora sp. NPDC052896]|uniref:DUF5655 domain-containing protein n=1 Tax=Kitasatospora sp. NPDC052896 TaxID=3364061 RepID=UPI0037CC7951
MTDLKLFRLDADKRDVEVQGSLAALESQLQERIEASMETMLGIRFLASEYPTGPLHRGRIDSLGLDENGTPVIIEYKRGNDPGVIVQAVSYLSWLDASHHEFQALVKDKLGDEAANAINWRNPRVVCIAGEFTRHARTAVHKMHQRIDLVRYRIFDGGLLSLQLVESTPGGAGAPRPATARPAPVDLGGGTDPSGDAEMKPIEEDLAAKPAALRALYQELHEALTSSGDVEAEATKRYFVFRRFVTVATVWFLKADTIMLYLKVDPSTVTLEEGFTRDMRAKNHLGTGDLEVRIQTTEDLEKSRPLIQLAFEAA